jgi:Mn2+/Fe2+ NRAMP family transporter
MGDALRLLVGGPALVYAAGFGLLCALLEIFLSYGRYVTVLKWTTLSLFAYVATALVVEVPWRAVAWSTLVPDLRLDHNYITAFVAVMGTTISPYLFFWQSSQEAEDERANPAAHPLILTPREAPRELRRIEFDTTIGMALSNLVALSIVVTTAATLNAAGTTDIASSGEAAQALRPLAGPLAFVLFALGIVGTGMLAVPVLAGSAAYAIGEARRWPVGLGRRPREARAFYGTIAAATLIGVAINLLGLDPIKALFWSAVVNMGATAIGMVATAF